MLNFYEFSPALQFVVLGFAVYRLTQFWVFDDAPFYLMKDLHAWLGKKAAGKSEKNLMYNIAGLFDCPYCMGVWVTEMFLLFALLPSKAGGIIILLFGISGLQSFLETIGCRVHG